ncbi:MAG: hypothetical protein DRQ40_09805 [Gammaproteobacteria bacterium]|nr:MAG: hypothetical protein DRQ40_09805 [Gammaproteobacteria bacterium]
MFNRFVTVLFVIFLVGLLSACDNAPPAADVSKIELPAASVKSVGDAFDTESGDWQFFDGSWEFRQSNGNGVLVQAADNLGRRAFPLALWKQHRFSDTDVSARFKPISGEMDASGGIVIRASDGGNYYVARANSLEDNIRLYTFVDGNRSQIAGTSIPAPALGQWHSLRMIAQGSRIQVYLNDTLYIDHQDETFADGYVGLWTKADAVTEFDDLKVSGIPAGAE